MRSGGNNRVTRTVTTLFVICLLLAGLPAYAGNRLVCNTLNGTAPMVKVVNRILKEAYRELGFEIELQHLPPKRALKGAQYGLVDGELMRVDRLDVRFPSLIKVPVPVGWIEGVAFAVRPLNLEKPGWEGLEPYSIAVIRGVQFSDLPTRHMNRRVVGSLAQIFKMLLAGRIDIGVFTRIGVDVYIAQSPLRDRIRILEPPITRQPLYHYLHQRHAALVPRLSEVLQQMSDSGRIGVITRQTIAEMTEKREQY